MTALIFQFISELLIVNTYNKNNGQTTGDNIEFYAVITRRIIYIMSNGMKFTDLAYFSMYVTITETRVSVKRYSECKLLSLNFLNRID